MSWLQVAESEVYSLRIEKARYTELERELSDLKSRCSCSKGISVVGASDKMNTKAESRINNSPAKGDAFSNCHEVLAVIIYINRILVVFYIYHLYYSNIYVHSCFLIKIFMIASLDLVITLQLCTVKLVHISICWFTLQSNVATHSPNDDASECIGPLRKWDSPIRNDQHIHLQVYIKWFICIYSSYFVKDYIYSKLTSFSISRGKVLMWLILLTKFLSYIMIR